jgi:iron complex outermembrane recepter protein
MPTSSFVSRAYSKTRLRHALLAATVTLSSIAFPALATTKLRLDIPAQDLGSALRELSADANEQVLFSQAVVAGRRSNKLRGDYTTDTALAILLDGTDLRVERTQSGVLLILPANAAAGRSPPAAATPPPEAATPLIRLAQSIDAPASDATA